MRLQKRISSNARGVLWNIYLPLSKEKIKKSLIENKVECVIADTPTKYLCNTAYFHMLNKTDGKAVFVHIPSLKNMQEEMIKNIVNSMEKIKDSVV